MRESLSPASSPLLYRADPIAREGQWAGRPPPLHPSPAMRVCEVSVVIVVLCRRIGESTYSSMTSFLRRRRPSPPPPPNWGVYPSILTPPLSLLHILDKRSQFDRKTPSFNQVKPKNDVEARVYEVLSHKNWGASTTLMNEISQDTFDYERCEFSLDRGPHGESLCLLDARSQLVFIYLRCRLLPPPDTSPPAIPYFISFSRRTIPRTNERTKNTHKQQSLS